MVILQGILDVPENIFGYALIMDTVNYSIWVMFLFWLVLLLENSIFGRKRIHLSLIR